VKVARELNCGMPATGQDFALRTNVLEGAQERFLEEAMPKLRHIAIAAEDPEAMAEFYKKAFDFKEVGRPNGYLADGVFLSDGTLNMAILKFKTDQLGKGMDYRGIHHFGVLVEDVEEFTKKLEGLGAEHYIDQGQGGHQAGYFEKKFYGPEHILFDIAEHGWAGAEPLPAPMKDAAE
jgi:catechol 2,3-dioxygenase-like lactoylglutathione lyase family enzyme